MKTMYLDKKLARKIVKEELAKGEKIEQADVVLAGDEFWNTETIWKDGKRVVQRNIQCYPQSYWATPTLVIYYTDGKEKRVPVFTEEDEQ